MARRDFLPSKPTLVPRPQGGRHQLQISVSSWTLLRRMSRLLPAGAALRPQAKCLESGNQLVFWNGATSGRLLEE